MVSFVLFNGDGLAECISNIRGMFGFLECLWSAQKQYTI